MRPSSYTVSHTVPFKLVCSLRGTQAVCYDSIVLVPTFVERSKQSSKTPLMERAQGLVYFVVAAVTPRCALHFTPYHILMHSSRSFPLSVFGIQIYVSYDAHNCPPW